MLATMSFYNRFSLESPSKSKSGILNRSSSSIQRSDTFTIKPDIDEVVEEQSTYSINKNNEQNFNTFTRRKAEPPTRVCIDVFDPLYARKSSPLQELTESNEPNSTIHHKFDGSTFRKSSLKTRKPVTRAETFIKQNSFLNRNKCVPEYGEHQDGQHHYDHDGRTSDKSENSQLSNDQNRNKISNVMSWFVDLKPNENGNRDRDEPDDVKHEKSGKLLKFFDKNYDSLPRSRASSVNRAGTKEAPVHVEFERRWTVSNNKPITIEIRNPPLYSQEKPRPVGVAIPYSSSQLRSLEDKNRQIVPPIEMNSRHKPKTEYKKKIIIKKPVPSNPKPFYGGGSSTGGLFGDNKYQYNSIQSFWKKKAKEADTIPKKSSFFRNQNYKRTTEVEPAKITIRTQSPSRPIVEKHPTPVPGPAASKPRKFRQIWNSLNNRMHTTMRRTYNNNNNDQQQTSNNIRKF